MNDVETDGVALEDLTASSKSITVKKLTLPEKFKSVRKRILLLVAIVQLFTPVTGTAYLPSTPSIQSEFHATDFEISLTFVSYTIVTGIMPLFHGQVSDRFGRKSLLFPAMIGYFGSLLISAGSTNIWILIGSRLVTGFFNSGFTTYCNGIMADILSKDERATYLGLTLLPAMLASTVAPTICGLLTTYFGWRVGSFLSLALLTLPVLPLVFFFVPETLESLQFGDPNFRTVRPKSYLFNPLHPLILSLKWPMVGVALCNSCVFSAGYLVNAEYSTLLAEYYPQFTATILGLLLLPIGFGRILGSIGGGKVSDIVRKRFASSPPSQQTELLVNDGQYKVDVIAHSREKKLPLFGQLSNNGAALLVGLFSALGASICTSLYGWLSISVVSSCVLSFFLGIFFVSSRSVAFAHCITIYKAKAAAGTAGLISIQFLISSAMLLLVDSSLSLIGVGWTFTAIGVIVLITCIPFTFVIRQS